LGDYIWVQCPRSKWLPGFAFIQYRVAEVSYVLHLELSRRRLASVIMKGDKVQPDDSHHVSGQSNEHMTRPAHALTSAQVADELQANTNNGLSSEEAATRLTKYGSNDLGEEKGVSAFSIFVQQIFNSMTLVSSNHF
jgi:magnesium-transporting ATPase (P-type)